MNPEQEAAYNTLAAELNLSHERTVRDHEWAETAPHSEVEALLDSMDFVAANFVCA